MQPPSSRLSTVAAWLRVLTLVCIISLVLGHAYAALNSQDWLADRLHNYPDTPQLAELSGSALAALAVVDLISLLLTLVVLWHLLTLLSLYQRGRVLTPDNAKGILRIGQGLVALAAFGVLAQTLDILAITWGNPSGQRQLTLSLTHIDVELVLAGGVMMLIGWAMQQAAEMADDHAAII